MFLLLLILVFLIFDFDFRDKFIIRVGEVFVFIGRYLGKLKFKVIWFKDEVDVLEDDRI